MFTARPPTPHPPYLIVLYLTAPFEVSLLNKIRHFPTCDVELGFQGIFLCMLFMKFCVPFRCDSRIARNEYWLPQVCLSSKNKPAPIGMDIHLFFLFLRIF